MPRICDQFAIIRKLCIPMVLASGLAYCPLTMAELIERTADYNPPKKLAPPKNWQEFIDRPLDEE